MTQVIQVDPSRPEPEAIERASVILRNGGLVAFPTETVYGLGADAMNERAVRTIFEAKGRPTDNPLIVHVSSREMLDAVASCVGETAARLIEKFWPGPLTLVLQRKPAVAPSVSAGLSTVAVRMPRNQIALDLITHAGTPLAAPSANASGRPSPTSAKHVLDDLEGKLDMILDGGSTNIGIESTVLNVTNEPPTILRPGWITQEMLSEAIGSVTLAASDDEVRRSPGTRHRHYSPSASVILIERGSRQFIEQLCLQHLKRGPIGFIGHTPISLDDPRLYAVFLRDNADDYGNRIYDVMRDLDRKEPGAILVEGICEKGKGVAVMDRIRRAASQIMRER